MRAGGINKSMIEVEGRWIIEHQLERLATVFPDPPTLITDRGEDYASFDVRTLRDFDEAPAEERFPLRGFARALAAAEGWAFLMAADMPWPDPALIREQAARLAASSSEETPAPRGLVLEDAGHLQPFHAFYHGELAASARAALASEDRSLRRWIRGEPAIAVRPAAEFESAGKPGFRGFAGFNVPPAGS